MAKAKINPEFTYKTRDGREVRDVVITSGFQDNDPYVVRANIEGYPEFFTDRGYYYNGGQINPTDLIKQPMKKVKEVKKQEPNIPNVPAVKHKHHDLIVEWAKNPKLVVQLKSHDGKWKDIVGRAPSWDDDMEYRIKPEESKLLTIIGADGKARSYPEPCSDALEQDVKYFIASAVEDEFQFSATWWNDRSDNNWLDRGLVHLTKEAAEAHAKAMLGID